MTSLSISFSTPSIHMVGGDTPHVGEGGQPPISLPKGPGPCTLGVAGRESLGTFAEPRPYVIPSHWVPRVAPFTTTGWGSLNQVFISHGSGGSKSKVKAPEPAPGEGSLLACGWLPSHRVLTQGHAELSPEEARSYR